MYSYLKRKREFIRSCGKYLNKYKIYVTLASLDRPMSRVSEARNMYERVFEALEAHQNLFENSIPLIASENVPSPAVREAILSDFGNRYAE